MHRRPFHIRHPRLLLVTGTVATALLAAACGGGPDRAPPRMPAAPATTTPSEVAPSPQVTQPPESPAARAPRELRFSAPALDGGTIRGRDFAGKDLVIWFWAPW